MKNHLTIALTGGIGSGKSTVARALAECGAYIVDADELSREVVSPGSRGFSEVVAAFGPEVIASDGGLNRKKLGEIVFSDPLQRKQLEAIVHPLIRSLWLARLEHYKSGTPPNLIVYVVPLLFESGESYPEIEKKVLVTSTETNRLHRIVNRDDLTLEEAKRRLAAQLPDIEKAPNCDYILTNDHSIQELVAQTRQLFSRLTR